VSRRKSAVKRPVLADARYDSQTVSKFINALMYEGKKATYQVPVEVRPDRRTALAMRWLITFSRDRNEKSMAEKLAAEIILASRGEGNAVKKKEDTHRMADANKAFAHYRW
jgi:small subunit ribosomal protein S7